MMYCVSACYTTTLDGNGEATWSTDGYDGATSYGPVQVGVDYDVGSSGGQFMVVVTSDQAGAFDALSEGEKTALWAG